MESNAAKSRAAAVWLCIITMDVLLIAGSVGSILVARFHRHCIVGSSCAHCRRMLILDHQMYWNMRGLCSIEH